MMISPAGDGKNKQVKRAFISIDLPKEIRREIILYQKSLRGYTFGKMVPEENLHITVFFLGDKEFDLERLRNFLRNYRFNKEIVIEGIDAFPNMNHPRVLFFRVLTDLGKVHSDLANFLGIKEEKGFVPHITICRIEKIRKEIPEPRLRLTFKATSIHLYNSDYREYDRID